MGIFSGTDIPRQSTTYLLNTPPPELVSPSSSTYSSRISEERSWGAAGPVSPPMSSYDPSVKSDYVPAGKGTDDGRARRDMGESLSAAASQRLPSLSALFGSHPLRPLQSPHSDHPSPSLYGGVSPLDRPQSASTNPERSFSNSYFPTRASSPPPPHQPRILHERPSLPQLSSYLQSPRARGDFEPVAHHGSRHESVSSRWSHHSSISEPRPDYVLATGEVAPAAGRTIIERRSYQPLSHKRSFETYEQHQQPDMSKQSQPQPRPAPQQPQPVSRTPNSPSPGASETAPVKDGLGPKIWTGTHFLPRFVGQYDVPGEGPCYFYDDGTHCKMIIDGEPVVAHWGVTKAGKPRKRLAIACLTCREKKIKCDPDFPRCVQCEKFGRICKFKNAPRGGHGSPELSPVDDSRQLGAPQQQARHIEHNGPRTTSTSVSPRPLSLKSAAPELLPLPPSKMARISYDHHQQHQHQHHQHQHQHQHGHYVAPPPPPPSSLPTRHPQPPSPMTPSHRHEGPRGGGMPWGQLPRIHEDVLHQRPWQPESRPRAPL